METRLNSLALVAIVVEHQNRDLGALRDACRNDDEAATLASGILA
jgi:hypothetical protein